METARAKISSLFLLIALVAGMAGGDEPASNTVSPHESFTVESKVLGETRRVNVYQPPGYDAKAARRYPVLYLLDGGVEGEDWLSVAATVDAAIRAGEMRPMIMIGIANTERRRDLTGPTTVEEDKKIAPRVGGSAAFRGFLRDELMPEVSRRYPVTDETAIVGESLAGLFIVETFFLAPAMFDTYLAFDPSLWWNNEELARQAGERLKARNSLPAALYLSSAGEESIAAPTGRLAEALRAHAPKDLRWKYTHRPDLRHDNIYRTELPGALRAWLAPR